MKEIDFVPAWYLAAQQGRRDVIIRVAYLGVIVGAMGVLAVVRYAQSASAAGVLSKLRSELKDDRTTVGALVSLRTRYAELERKQGLAKDLEAGAPAYALVAELTNLLPEAIVITSLQMVEGVRPALHQMVPPATPAPQPAAEKAAGESEGRLEVKGLAAADIQVGHLMARMSSSAVFTDVKLSYCKPVRLEGREAREFALACRLPRFE